MQNFQAGMNGKDTSFLHGPTLKKKEFTLFALTTYDRYYNLHSFLTNRQLHRKQKCTGNKSYITLVENNTLAHIHLHVLVQC